MSIEYTNSHYWLKPVKENILEPYSKSNREKLKSTLKQYTEHNIEFEIAVVTETVLDWFIPLYTNLISSKSNPSLHDVRESTLEDDREYFALILKQDKVALGATIFSIKDWYVSIAYRAYPNNWQNNIKLRSNPSLLSDYFIAEYTQSIQKEWISHGLDRNPYGPNSYIGLAAFKLSVGCKAFIPTKTVATETLDTSEINTETLVLHRPTEKTRITEATLFVKPEDEEKYQQVTKYPDLLKVNIVHII